MKLSKIIHKLKDDGESLSVSMPLSHSPVMPFSADSGYEPRVRLPLGEMLKIGHFMDRFSLAPSLALDPSSTEEAWELLMQSAL